MSTGTRVPLEKARRVAALVRAQLLDATERVEIAGSIRRGRSDVGDIELVAVPRFDPRPEGMFETRRVNLLTESVDEMVRAGVLEEHPTDPKRGDRYSKLMDPWTGLQVDLFSASRETFGIIFLIRTGPAAYSQRFVTDLRRRDLHVSGGQLHRGSLGCGAYVCELIPTPEETDVFSAAGWKYVRPEMRA